MLAPEKILEGETTFRWVYMENFRSACCTRREEIKDGERQKQNALRALLLSLMAFITTFSRIITTINSW